MKPARRAAAPVCAGLLLLLAATTAAADELSFVFSRTGIVDSAWTRKPAGPIEHLMRHGRDKSAGGFGVREYVPLMYGVGVGLESGVFGDQSTLGLRDAAMSAIWSGWTVAASADERWTQRRTGLFAAAGIDARLLFTHVYLSGIDSNNGRRAVAPLATVRASGGWSAADVWPLFPLVISLQFGISEVKPIRYGDWGTLNVGGWQAALSVGGRFSGFDRLLPRRRPPAGEQPAAAAPAAPPAADAARSVSEPPAAPAVSP